MRRGIIYIAEIILCVSCLMTGCSKSSSSSNDALATTTPAQTVRPATNAKATATPDSEYYSIATTKTKKQVEAFAQKIQKKFAKKDWKGLSEMISYPIVIDGKSFNDSKAFLDANIKFSDDFLYAVKHEKCTDMFNNSNGIMLANGEVWIAEICKDGEETGDLKIISINVY